MVYDWGIDRESPGQSSPTALRGWHSGASAVVIGAIAQIMRLGKKYGKENSPSIWIPRMPSKEYMNWRQQRITEKPIVTIGRPIDGRSVGMRRMIGYKLRSSLKRERTRTLAAKSFRATSSDAT